MARQRIHEQATTAADPDTVYAMLADGPSWPEWSPIDAYELERPGNGEPEGVGAVRVLRNGRVTGRDTIAELVPGRRFAYTHVSSLPVRDYRGEVDLEPGPDGTVIHWRASFEPTIPLTGAFLRRALSRFLRQMTDGLAAGAARRAAVGA
jgi:hypothetical protein